MVKLAWLRPVPDLLEVETPTLPLERFQGVIAAERYERFMAAAERARRAFAGRTIWTVSSTARGGGVAEMLRSLIAYVRGAGIEARWLVIPGGPDFFRVTKRIHNHLHGAAGDGGHLDREARAVYEQTLQPTAEALAARVGPADIVLVHDPQPAGLIPLLRRVTPHVVWRCHVGIDTPNDLAREAWRFLLPYVQPAAAYVFSRASFAWEGLEPAKIRVIPPSIDPFSPKNHDLSRERVESILTVAGILDGGPTADAGFRREDGTEAWVSRRAELVEVARATIEDRLVLQVSRWDRLKDPVGVIRGFADHVAPHTDAHLVVAGPAIEAVADDPEGRQVLRESMEAWESVPAPAGRRVHLATLPMADSEENAAMVNALQRQAAVVVQKSLAEGFGLTVAEAMWKGRPVAASRIGGIQDQVEDGLTGVLLDDPSDLAEFGVRVRGLLEDPPLAERMGRAARERVRDHFLGPRHLMQYMDLLEELLRRSGA
jgi:trehalose synthase